MSGLTINTDIPELRNRSVESFIADFVGVAELKMVPLSFINIKESHNNQARLTQPIDSEMANQYARDMQAGAVFPPIVCTTTGVAADGNHRVAGALTAGIDRLAAYVIDVNRAVFDDIAAAANEKNGKPPTDDERAFHIVRLHKDGLTNAEIAARLSVPPTTVALIVKSHTVAQRIGRPKFTGVMAPSTLAAMNVIQSDELLRLAAQAASANGMTATEVHRMAQRIAKAGSETAALQIIAEATRTPKPKRKRRAPDDAANLRRASTLLQKVNPHKLALTANGSSDELLGEVGLMVSTLADIEKAMAK